MSKILALDLGTDSVGWSIRNTRLSGLAQIEHHGVMVFPKGVGEEKNSEFSLAAERTLHRSVRKQYRRRRYRKFKILELLLGNGMCPMTKEELAAWVFPPYGTKPIYPQRKEIADWFKINPYEARNVAAASAASLHEIGRAIYHMAQRRGFKSNRKDENTDSDKDLGVVKGSIEEIDNSRGNLTLGQFFFEEIAAGGKVRTRHTSRSQYEEEFDMVAKNFSQDLAHKLKDVFLFQRPLKSQKHLVGFCSMEKPVKDRQDKYIRRGRSKIPVSHPLFELFRAYSFINSVKISTSEDEKPNRFLKKKEREILLNELLVHKELSFRSLRKKLEKGAKEKQVAANFDDDTKVAGCPTIRHLADVLGVDWLNEQLEMLPYKGTGAEPGIYTYWHSWSSFDDKSKLQQWAEQKIGLDSERAKMFAKGVPADGYGSLSHKAIASILPFLKTGMLYSHAVLLAKVPDVLGTKVWDEHGERITEDITAILNSQKEENLLTEIINSLIGWFKEEADNAHADYKLDKTDLARVKHQLRKDWYKWEELPEAEQSKLIKKVAADFEKQLQNNRGTFLKKSRINEKIQQYLLKNHGVREDVLQKLYHPSETEIYTEVQPDPDDYKCYLNSPATSSVRNPMAMRTLYQVRKLVNYLIQNDWLDEDDQVIIEVARELHTANERKAIQNWQGRLRADRDNARDKIKEIYREQFGKDIHPTEDDVLRFKLWEEQKLDGEPAVCLYTGKAISLSDVVGGSSKFDLEHTLPRSQSFDNSTANLTLCDSHYNRQVKGKTLPALLPNFEQDTVQGTAIKPRLGAWEKKLEDLRKQIRKKRNIAKSAGTKEAKDSALQKMFELKLEADYWRNKIKGFFVEEVPEGFRRSQITDTGLITKLSRAYLSSVFGRNKVHVVSGQMLAQFRQAWGFEAEHEKKRDTHLHHALDAIVLSCITRQAYNELAHFYHQKDNLEERKQKRAQMPTPWGDAKDFVNDVRQLLEHTLIAHQNKDKALIPAKKRARKGGKVQYQIECVKENLSGKRIPIYKKDSEGKRLPVWQQGDSIRGALHLDTFYGKIKTGEDAYVYVVRKKLISLSSSDVEKIVDERIRALIKEVGLKKVQKEIKQNGKYMPPAEFGKKANPIVKVRLKANLAEPLELRKQIHKSKKEAKPWKEQVYVQNAENYQMVLYSYGINGKTEIKHEIINLLEAAERNKKGELYPITVQRKKGKSIRVYDLMKRNGKPLAMKKGQLALLFEQHPDEIDWQSRADLSRRLYKILSFEKDGRLQLRYHQEARMDKDLKKSSSMNFKAPPEKLRLSISNFSALLEGIDFEVAPDGNLIAANS